LGKVRALVDATLADVQRTKTKVDVALAPLVQSLATAHLDAIVQLDSLTGAAVVSRLDALDKRVNAALAPLVESLAIAQVDTKEKLDGLDAASLIARLNALDERAATATTRHTRKEARAPHGISACEFDLAAEHEAPLKTQASNNRSEMVQDLTGDMPCELDEAIGSPVVMKRSPSQSKHTVRVGSDGRLHLGESSKNGEPSPGKSSRFGTKHRRRGVEFDVEWGDALSAPFARCVGGSRQLERRCSRSVPVLPPVF